MDNTKKEITAEMITALRKPLPAEAIKQHPTKNYLSTIKVIYMIERLNEVFGLGGWKDDYVLIENSSEAKMIVVRGYLDIPEYGIERQAFGGNDNADRGDAYKGACTDAMSKMCSTLYIGMDVYKGLEESGVPKKRKAETEEVQGLKCEDCHRVITAVTQPGGVVAPLAKVLDNSRQKWNLDLCGGCQIARAKKDKAEPTREEEVPLKDPEVIHADSGECFVQGTVTEIFIQKPNKPFSLKLGTVLLSCWHKSLIEPLKLSKGAKIDVVCSTKGDFKNIEKVNRIGNIEFSDNVPVIRRDAEESLYA